MYIYLFQYGSHVLQHYVTFYNDFGDIMKMTLSRLRDNHKVRFFLRHGFITNFDNSSLKGLSLTYYISPSIHKFIQLSNLF